MGYTRQVINGLSWVSLLRISNRFISFGKTAILARILTPAQFGLFGVAALVLSFLEMITETGINIFLVQEDQDDTVKDYLHTAWIVSLVRGAIIGLGIFIAAPYLAAFFNNSGSIYIIRLIALVPIIRGTINPGIANFQKQLKFREEFLFRLAVTIVDTLVAVTVALSLQTSDSLVWGMIAASITETIMSHLLIKPRPKLFFEAKKWFEIIHRGKWVTSAGILTYFSNQGPDFFISKFLDSTTLGLYQIAYKLSMLFVTEVNDIFNRVTFPIYVKIINDRRRVTVAFIKNTLVVTMLLLPVSALFILFPTFLLRLAVGDQWLGASQLVQLLSIFGILATIGASSSPLFLAAKRQDYLSHISLLRVIVVVLTIIPCIQKFGVTGAIYSLILSAIISIPVRFWYVYRVLKP